MKGKLDEEAIKIKGDITEVSEVKKKKRELFTISVKFRKVE